MMLLIDGNCLVESESMSVKVFHRRPSSPSVVLEVISVILYCNFPEIIAVS